MSDELQFPEMIQTVKVTFEDGTEGSFSGPAILFEGESKRVVGVTFGPPKQLPAGCSWGEAN